MQMESLAMITKIGKKQQSQLLREKCKYMTTSSDVKYIVFTLEEKVHARNETRCPHCGEVIKVDEYDDYEEVDSCGGFYGDTLEDN